MVDFLALRYIYIYLYIWISSHQCPCLSLSHPDYSQNSHKYCTTEMWLKKWGCSWVANTARLSSILRQCWHLSAQLDMWKWDLWPHYSPRHLSATRHLPSIPATLESMWGKREWIYPETHEIHKIILVHYKKFRTSAMQFLSIFSICKLLTEDSVVLSSLNKPWKKSCPLGWFSKISPFAFGEFLWARICHLMG